MVTTYKERSVSKIDKILNRFNKMTRQLRDYAKQQEAEADRIRLQVMDLQAEEQQAIAERRRAYQVADNIEHLTNGTL